MDKASSDESDRLDARLVAANAAAMKKAIALSDRINAVTVNHMADLLGVCKPARQTAIDHMLTAEALTPVNNFRRNRVWVATEVTAALDAFAQRSGRRRSAAG